MHCCEPHCHQFIRRTPNFTKYYNHQDDSLRIVRHIVAPYADGSRAVPMLLSTYCHYMTEQQVSMKMGLQVPSASPLPLLLLLSNLKLLLYIADSSGQEL
jgi:hypothetical protein